MPISRFFKNISKNNRTEHFKRIRIYELEETTDRTNGETFTISAVFSDGVNSRHLHNLVTRRNEWAADLSAYFPYSSKDMPKEPFRYYWYTQEETFASSNDTQQKLNDNLAALRANVPMSSLRRSK